MMADAHTDKDSDDDDTGNPDRLPRRLLNNNLGQYLTIILPSDLVKVLTSICPDNLL